MGGLPLGSSNGREDNARVTGEGSLSGALAGIFLAAQEAGPSLLLRACPLQTSISP